MNFVSYVKSFVSAYLINKSMQKSYFYKTNIINYVRESRTWAIE